MSRTETSGKQPTAFLCFLLVVYGIAFIGYLGIRRGLPGWYDSLLHPSLTPAPWVFGPVWSILYVLIGFAGWQLWNTSPSSPRKIALIFFGLQLVLNSLWTWLFFGYQHPLGSLIELCFLWTAILITIFAAGRIKPAIAGLLVPYLLWVSFAGYLNFGIWSLNYKNHQGVGRIETVITR